MIYALDTNMISFILRKNENVKHRWRQEELKGNRVLIPLIAYYEVRRGLLAKDAKRQMNYFDDLCAVLGVHDLTIADINTASEIYANLKSTGKFLDDDADLLIAAQCLTNGYTVVTNNKRHFENIKGLQMVDWSIG